MLNFLSYPKKDPSPLIYNMSRSYDSRLKYVINLKCLGIFIKVKLWLYKINMDFKTCLLDSLEMNDFFK